MLKIIIVMCIMLSTIDGDDSLKIPGDFIIGALLRMRRSSDPFDPSMKCEKIREVHGLQRLEAALLALDMINNDTKILPGVTLGIEVRDICRSETSALRESLSLVKYAALNVWANSQMHYELSQKDSTMIGVIGPDTSERTMQVQNLLKLFHIPQIGFVDQTPELDDKSKYWTFLRIIPSDIFQTYVIRDILKKFHWTYVATVTSSGIFNDRLTNSFRNLMEPKCNGSGICIAKDLQIEKLSNNSVIDEKILEIHKEKLVNVVICFCDYLTLRRLFESMKRLHLTNRFTIIASDRWTDLDSITDGVEEQAWGSISVNIHAPRIPFFSKYYTSLKPSKHTRNPWFKTFWQEKFNCTLPMESVDIKKVNSDDNIHGTHTSSKKFCTGNENLAEDYHEYRYIGFMMKAIWAMAHGLHSMMTEVCGLNYTGVCPKMYPVNTANLMNHLMKLSFYYNDELVTINNEGLSLRYDITNFQKLPNNTFALVHIGEWTNGTLKFHKGFQSGEYKNVTSVCSLPCPIGYHKTFARDNKNQECCWTCKPCGDYEYVSWNKEQCIKCSQDERSNANRTGCDKIPIDDLWLCPMNLMIFFFAAIGLISTFFTFYIFIKYKDTPVVKASSREICYVILFGMILAHISAFILLVSQSSLECALSRSLPAIAFTMMFAGLFTKTHRIATILVHSESRFPKKKHRLMSTSAQVAITFCCVAIEIAICSVMLLISPPELTLTSLSRDHLTLVCLTNTTDVLPPAVFVLILQFLCILYTIKTRNVPGNFNEAKFIGFAMLITLVIFIAAITMFSEIRFRSQIMSTCLTLNASAVSVFLFIPKLYIIIFKPERNKRSLFITNKSIRTHIGPRVNGNISEPWVDHSTNLSPTYNFTIPEHSCRLRRTVAVQTSSRLFRDISSSSDENDDELLSDNDFNSKHDNGLALSESNKDIVVAVNNNHERISCPRKNIFRRGEKFLPMRLVKSLNDRLNSLWHKRAISANNPSSTTTPKSCVELNVNNLLRPENDG